MNQGIKKENGKYKLIIFDFADVLAKVWEIRSKAFLHTAEELGWQKKGLNELKRIWGVPIANMVSMLWPYENHEVFEETYCRIKSKYPIQEIDGATNTVLHIIKAGYSVGILTSVNSCVLHDNLEQIGMGDINFSFLQSSNDTNHHKPDGRVFLPALKYCSKYNIKSSHMLYVGDDMIDWLACKSINVPFVAILTGKTTRKQFEAAGVSCKRILRTVNDLPKFLSISEQAEGVNNA